MPQNKLVLFLVCLLLVEEPVSLFFSFGDGNITVVHSSASHTPTVQTQIDAAHKTALYFL